MPARGISRTKILMLVFCLLNAVLAPHAEGIWAEGGTVTNFSLNGTNFTAHIFTNVGITSLTFAVGGDVEYLVVAGGGGGGGTENTSGWTGGGGGGAGGIVAGATNISVPSITIVVGTGGLAGATSTPGGNGSNSLFGVIVAFGGGGGGRGGNSSAPERIGKGGGSGGGSGYRSTAGGPATNTQGYAGGYAGTGEQGSGGGGGAGSAGGNGLAAPLNYIGGTGGVGWASAILGTTNYYAGGGGAGGISGGYGDGSNGGPGGGGNGAKYVTTNAAVAGTPGTGGGGGGGTRQLSWSGPNILQPGAAGGSGIVIVRYVATPPDQPVIGNGLASNVAATSADLAGTLITNGTSAATVYLFCATNDCTTNEANWIAAGAVATNFGPFTAGAAFTNTLTELASNTWYYWNHMASNTAGKTWAATASSPAFKTRGAPGVDNGAGATNIGFYGVILNGTLTNGVNANVYINWWTNGASVTNLIDFGPARAEGGLATNLTGLTPGTVYGYQVFASNTYGTATADPTNFSTTPMYVYVALTGGSAPYDGSSWAHAYTNLQDAIDAACASQVICIAAHTFTNSVPQSGCQYLWTNKPLTIVGGYAADGGNPGAFTNTPTILGRGAAAARILYIGGVTNGTLQRVTLAGGYGYRVAGMGLYVAASSNLTVGSCVISNNYTWSDNNPGGTKSAGIYFTGSDVRLTNCIVTLNTAYGYGKNYAICWGGGIYVASGRVSLDGCLVDRNFANGHPGDANGSRGGGIYLESGSLAISNSVVANNRAIGIEATRVTGYGGGFYVAGGTCSVWNTLISGNAGVFPGYGYGLRVEGAAAAVSLNHCTVVSHAGDALNRTSGSLVVSNSIVWGNVDDIMGVVTLGYCDVKDGDNNGTNGCFSADPLFQTVYYLDPSSPCVNTGSMTAAAAGLSNRTTMVDGTLDDGVVDLGYHYARGLDLTYADIYVAPDGDDLLNSGTNAASPFRTITKALATATDGSRIHIAAGSYTNGSETFPLTLTGRSGVQLLGTNSTATIINANGSGQRVLTLSSAAGGARVEGLTFTGGRPNAGGLYIGGGSDVSIVSCVVSNNRRYAGNGVTSCGGGVYVQDSSARLTDTLMMGNDVYSDGWAANAYGGGIYVQNSALELGNCRVERNGNSNSDNYSHGGGMHMASGILLISNSVIRYNTVKHYGGGVSMAAGALKMRNTLINGNAAGGLSYGYGLYAGGGSAALSFCTFATHAGDAVRVIGSVAMTNSILWGNLDDIMGAATLAYCDVKDGDNNGTNGCFSADPLFQAGYYLDPVSPCVNTGDVTAAASGLSNRTTRTDGALDDGVADLGYHYAQGLDLTYADIYVAPDGDDSLNNGTNAASPFRTITKALALATDGSRIHIAAGSYTNGSDVFPLTLSGKCGLRLLGTNSAATVVNANGSGQRVLTLSGAGGGTRLEGLTFTGGRPDAGGLYIGAGSDVSIISCVITNNRRYVGANAPSYGGGIYLQDSSVRLTNTLVGKNDVYASGWTGNAYGGGIYQKNSLLEVVNCQIERNSSTTSETGYGGGLHMASGSLMISNSAIRGNTVSHNGGGVCIGGGTLETVNILVVSNQSAYASARSDGFYIGGGAASFLNCTIASNFAVGVRYSAGTVAMTNCIVWGHTNTDLAAWPSAGGILQNVAYSLLGGPAIMDGTNGCIVGDPKFVNAATNNYTLRSVSPCVNNGFTFPWMAGAVDLGGNPRLNSTAVDMGAYENTWLPPPGSVFAWW